MACRLKAARPKKHNPLLSIVEAGDFLFLAEGPQTKIKETTVAKPQNKG